MLGCFRLDWVGLSRVGVCYFGLGWVRLGLIVLCWVGLVGLCWVRLFCVG